MSIVAIVAYVKANKLSQLKLAKAEHASVKQVISERISSKSALNALNKFTEQHF